MQVGYKGNTKTIESSWYIGMGKFLSPYPTDAFISGAGLGRRKHTATRLTGRKE